MTLPETHHINKYTKPTVELVLSLLASAYEDELKLDKVLKELSDDVFRELEKELRLLEKNGKINLEEPFDLRRNGAVYQALKRIETLQLRRFTDYCWMGAQVIGESMTRSYTNTMDQTFAMFNYTRAQDPYKITANEKHQPTVQVRDTYIYENAVKVPWCQDGKTYSDRLYGHVANFQKKLAFVLEEGINQGKGMEWMKEAWQKLTGSTAYATSRLLKTETMAMWSLATKEAYLEMGIEYVVMVGDAMCGGICLDYVDNEPVRLADAYVGDMLPPYHPNCACSYVAYEEVERVPIDEIDGSILDEQE